MVAYWLDAQRGTNSDFLHESRSLGKSFWHEARAFRELSFPHRLLLLRRSFLVACEFDADIRCLF